MMHDLKRIKNILCRWAGICSAEVYQQLGEPGNKHIFEEMGVKFVQIVNLTPVIALVQ